MIAYLIGSINFAVIFSNAFLKKDVRDMGSGNAGTTNVMRVAGFLPGALTFICDALKGFAACFLGKLIFEYIMSTAASGWAHASTGAYLCGFACMLGHIVPIFFGFKGGKGILSGVTVALMLDWRIGLLVFGIFLLAYMLTHYVSLGSVLSAGSFGPLYALIHPDAGFLPIAVCFFLSVLIVWMHRANIKRLLKGEERRTTLFGLISRNKK
mgnify:CR=1 FL=1